MIHDSILRRKGKKFGDRRQDFLQVKWQSDPGLNLHGSHHGSGPTHQESDHMNLMNFDDVFFLMSHGF